VFWSRFGWIRANTAAWIADAFRLVFGLIYWNLRKALFLARGRRGRNPCQNDADGDRRGSIRCDACISWSKPARFRRVCPLLTQHNGDWVCSAARNEVRPFWGRALAWYALFGASGYLAITAFAFGVLRATHAADVKWVDVAWPGRWDEIPKARARTFTFRAAEAFLQNRPAEGLLSLGSARRLDRREYRTRLLDAQLAMFQFNVSAADAEFARMLEEYPEQATGTAITFHDTLLMLFRAEPLAGHCLHMASRDRDRMALWVRSLLHALRLAPVAESFVSRHSTEVATLPAHARLLLEAELAAQRGDATGARAILSQPFDGPRNLIYMHEQIARLAQVADPDAAVLLLNKYAGDLGEFEALLARVDLDLLAGDVGSAQLDFHRLLQLMNSPVQAERIIALLVSHPQPDLFRALHDALRQQPALAQQVSGAAMWIAGLLCQVLDEAQIWKISGLQQPGDGYPLIAAVNFDIRQLDVPNGVPSLINTLTLPRDVVFALQRRMTPVTVPARTILAPGPVKAAEKK
jgi:hypothetical protein